MTTVFTCRDQFDDMMTCIYTAWSSRLGHANIRLMTEPFGTRELFCDYRHVEADSAMTASVVRTVIRRISPLAYRMVYRAAMSCDENKLDAIYRFLIVGFVKGASVTDCLQLPEVARLSDLDRRTANEAHYFREFIRFSWHGGSLISRIEPKSNILTLVAPHFADRLPSEQWLIADSNRRLAIVHPADSDYYLTSLSGEDLKHLCTRQEDDFTLLWKEFFEHTAIRHRKNDRCQRTLLPLWYRKNMTEFQ